MKDGCVDLNFALGAAGVSSTVVPARSWNIRVTQYDCNYNNLAPKGCTQYFFNPNSDTGTVKTFNYDGGAHLADQNQNICVRYEMLLSSAMSIIFARPGVTSKPQFFPPHSFNVFIITLSFCRRLSTMLTKEVWSFQQHIAQELMTFLKARTGQVQSLLDSYIKR